MADVAVRPRRATRNGLTKGDVHAVLTKRHPAASADDVSELADLMTAVYEALADLPRDKLRAVARSKGKLRHLLLRGTEGDLEKIAPEEAVVETSFGAGLGELVSLDEGRSRLDAYAVAKPLEDWAGPVAGAGKLEKSLGIKHSTLGAWYRSGAVIGLLRGRRKLAYPLDQFVDARPLEGLDAVLRVVGDPRATWLWMRQPHGALGNLTPLQVLRNGQVEFVITVAERDFA